MIRCAPSEFTGMGDQNEEQARFHALTEPFRLEIQAHCYRLIGSLHDAEDLAQETILRAWKSYAGFDGRAPRAWLYRIATHACLDALKRRPRRMLPLDAGPPGDPLAPLASPWSEPVWLEPYPDAWLSERPAEPEARYSLRQSVALAFLAALQRLPPRQRAVLLLRDVIGYSAREVAETLGSSEASVNSALQRARTALEAKGGDSTMRSRQTPGEATLVAKLVEAWEAANVDDLVALLSQDIVFTMPPIPTWYQGRANIAAGLRDKLLAGDAAGRFRFIGTAANGAAALGCYRRESNEDLHRAFGLLVLEIDGLRVSGMTLFNDPGLFGRFGLPETLEPSEPGRL